MKTLPQVIYDAYESADLLGIYPPKDDETLEQFINRVENTPFFGDALFLFILREMNDPHEDMDELINRLDRATHDLETVRNALIDRFPSREAKTG